jgi:hypothetical protein
MKYNNSLAFSIFEVHYQEIQYSIRALYIGSTPPNLGLKYLKFVIQLNV